MVRLTNFSFGSDAPLVVDYFLDGKQVAYYSQGFAETLAWVDDGNFDKLKTIPNEEIRNALLRFWPGQEYRVIQMEKDGYVYEYILLESLPIEAPYEIVVILTIVGERMIDWPSYFQPDSLGEWCLVQKVVGKVTLDQHQIGECKAALHFVNDDEQLEMNPWVTFRSITFDRIKMAVLSFWRDLINEWIRRRKDLEEGRSLPVQTANDEIGFITKEAPEPVSVPNNESEVFPMWWPKKDTTKRRWRYIYRQIRNGGDEKSKLTKIALKYEISRQLAAHILLWASLDSFAHQQPITYPSKP